MIGSDDQLYELPIAGLIFQEEIMDDSEHRFSYRYKRRVQIKVHVSMTDNRISLSLTSNKKNRKIKNLLSTIEAHLTEKIPEYPRYRMYLVTENKQIETDIEYDVEENRYLSMVDYHYGLWGKWVSILLMIGAYFWDLTIGEWVGWLLYGCLVVHIFYSMIRRVIRDDGDPRTQDNFHEIIVSSMGCLFVYSMIFASIQVLTMVWGT